MKYILLSLVLISISISIFAQSASESCSTAKQKSFCSKSKASSKSIADMNGYDVKYVRLNLDVNQLNTYITGDVTATAQVVLPGFNKYVFELTTSLTVDSVFINQQKLPFTIVAQTREVSLPSILPINSFFTAQVFYHGNPNNGGGNPLGSGLINKASPSWQNHVTYTQSESYAAYLWWPCKQNLHDKIDSSDVLITVPDSCKAGSNGLLQSVTSIGNHKVIYHWHNKHSIDNYLISIAVAEYIDYSIYAHPKGITDSVLIQNYVYNNPQTLPFFKANIDATKSMLEYFSSIYGLYPFADEKYGHCMAPLNGGMEHQTMTTIGSFGNLSVIAHELGHQWFGDNVTCGTWKDIWNNEGFAAYTEQLYFEHFNGIAAANTNMNNVHSSVLSATNGSVFVDDTTNESRIFDTRLTYDKGAAIIHTLRFEINNDSLFFLTLRNYQNQFKNNVAIGLDFKAVAENTTGKQFSDFFNQWYFGEGYPIYSVQWNQTDDNIVLVVSHQTSAPTITPLFKTSLQLTIHSLSGDTVIRVNLQTNSDTFFVKFSNPISNTNSIYIDPNNWVLNTENSIQQNSTLNTIPLFSTSITSKNNKLEIYPNPASNLLNVTSEIIFNKIIISDILGRNLLVASPTSTTNKIDISGLSNGVYFIKTIDASGIINNSKFIKQ
jgi:aminopeptidase N